MCQSQAEGGKRCASHTRIGYERARSALVSSGEIAEQMPVAARDELVEKYCRAVEAFAATPTGAEELQQRLRELDAGAPATGDLRGVIGHAVRPRRSPVADEAAAEKGRLRQKRQAALASLLAGKPVSAPPSTPTSTAGPVRAGGAQKPAQRPLSPEGHRLRQMMQSGAVVSDEEIAERTRVSAAAVAPVAFGAVCVRGEQAHLICGGAAAERIAVRADLTKRIEGRWHGVLTVDHGGAGEVRWSAVRDTATGAWEITGRAS